MKIILAVDLDDGTVGSLAAGLRDRQIDVRLQRAALARGAEAVRREAFDLVILDRGEPPASPAALVAALAETSPATRLLVVGAIDRQERALLAALGSVETVERPVEPAELAARVATALSRGVKGHLENVGLAAFVQLLALEKETCTLTVRGAAGTGTLFFLRGELVDAELAGGGGEEAAIEILDWEVADVEMTGSCLRSRRIIQRPLTFLLIEAMRRRDERGRTAEGAAGEAPAAAGGAGDRRVAGAGGGPAGGTLLDRLAAEVEGFVAAALVELATGSTVEALSTRPELDPKQAGAFFCELLRQEIGLLDALRLPSSLDDVVLTFDDQIHWSKLTSAGRMLYVVADRTRTNLPGLRAAMQRLWPAVEAVAASSAPPAAARRRS